MKRVALVLGIGLLLVAAVAAAGAFYASALLAPRAAEAPTVTFRIAPGEGLAQVSRNLESAELIHSAFLAKWLARSRGLETSLKAGEYALSAGLSTQEILTRLSSGNVKTYPLAVPEGLRATEIAQRLEDAGLADADALLELVRDSAFAASLGIEADSLEGYLFPETYQFARGLPPDEILRAFVQQFLEVWEDVREGAKQKGMSMQEIVTLASIVEKETGAPEERSLIAAVFLNRLRKKMRLETDPTVIYGIENFDGNLRRRDLENNRNPYNTYRIPGLPPGPIANPGRAALLAVVEPADSPYLYFVSKNDGTHFFSATYREHVNAVNRYQKRRRR